MAPTLQATSRAPGLFNRSGQLFLGGPAGGLLQQVMPAVRLVSLILFLLAVSLVHTVWIHCLTASLILLLAAWSGLSIFSIMRLVLIPVLLFALPAIIASMLFSAAAMPGQALFLSRVLASSILSSAVLHSIGLRNVSHVMATLKLPAEIILIWNIMVAQVVAFSSRLSSMAMARQARQVQPITASIARRQVGLQSALLFATTRQRGQDIAYAIQARTLDDQPVSPHIKSHWTVLDFATVAVASGAFFGAVLL